MAQTNALPDKKLLVHTRDDSSTVLAYGSHALHAEGLPAARLPIREDGRIEAWIANPNQSPDPIRKDKT